MYYFYIDGMELPVTPSKMTVKINNQNETVNLINEGEVNILKQPGLTDISFEFMLPANPYPFSNNSIDISSALSHLESLKADKAVFPLIVSRMTPAGQLLHDTNLTVKEVVERVGYLDESSFRKKFRTVYGITLSEFRAQKKESVPDFPNPRS